MKKGWELKRLDEVCTFINGRAYKKNELLSKGKYPVLRVGNFFTNNHWYYSDLELPIDKYCENGDLLYAWSASFGPRIWTGEKVIYHYHIWKVVPNINLITKEFLFLLLDWDTEKIKNDQGTGTTMMHVGKGSMDARIVPIPPLSEQQRIVAILDEAFSAIDQAKANAQQNLKNAKELFESYLQGVFEKKGEGWEEKTLGEMIEIKNGKNQQAVLSETGEYKIMGSAGNVMGYATDFICEAGTTIIGRKGNISKPIYINERFWNVDTAFGFYPKNEKDIDKRFVYYLCLGIDFKSMNRGTTIPSLVKSELQTIQFCFPKSLKTQQAIVKKLDALISETKKLEAIYQQKINDMEELKKSVLQKAFSGELKTSTALA